MKHKVTTLGFAAILAAFVLIGLAVWFSNQPVDGQQQEGQEEWGYFSLATTTPTGALETNGGWWDAMPTDPLLPTMPPIALASLTPSRTPKPTATPNSLTQTTVALTGTATPEITPVFTLNP